VRFTPLLLATLLAVSINGTQLATASPVLDPDPVQVFFSRNPDSMNDFTAVFPVPRDVPSTGLMEGAVAALIAGPNAAEAASGLFSDVRALITGTVSNCKGLDFTLLRAGGMVTLQLCRTTSSAGIGQDARAQAEIEATITQFPGVTKVIVLSSTGHCLFDESGLDICLMP
jgi:hypothetical protein